MVSDGKVSKFGGPLSWSSWLKCIGSAKTSVSFVAKSLNNKKGLEIFGVIFR